MWQQNPASLHSIKIRDAMTGRELLTLPTQGWAFGAAFSPDSKLLVASAGGEAILWDAASGKKIDRSGIFSSQPPNNGYDYLTMSRVAFSPDGKRVALAGSDRVVILDADLTRMVTGIAPRLLNPPNGVWLPNVRRNNAQPFGWSFEWWPVPGASSYNLVVKRSNALSPLIDKEIPMDNKFDYENDNSIADYSGWEWKVRARVGDQWSAWSESRAFSVMPVTMQSIAPSVSLGQIPSATASTGTNGIHEAAAAGDLAKVKLLLAQNPELVNARDSSGNTPLHEAVLARMVNNRKELVALLLANKADVNAQDNGYWTPLHESLAVILAGEERDYSSEVVDLLLANNADINVKDGSGTTPLHMVVRHGHKYAAELFLARGADVNAKSSGGCTPLHLAAFGGRKGLVELLLANKADINARDNGGSTPLHAAAWDYRNSTISRNGLTKKTSPSQNISSSLEKIYAAARQNKRPVTELLVANKAVVNPKDNSGRTPLDIATEQSIPDVADFLRQHGGKSGADK